MVVEPERRRARAQSGLEGAVAEHVEERVRVRGDDGRGNVEHEQRILLLDEPGWEDDVEAVLGEVGRRDQRAVVLVVGVDAGVDDAPLDGGTW